MLKVQYQNFLIPKTQLTVSKFSWVKIKRKIKEKKKVVSRVNETNEG